MNLLRLREANMLRLASAILVVFGSSSGMMPSSAADETTNCVRAECHGKLRHGIVAIGGETTGCTITFQSVVWELKLPDESTRRFAAEHHKHAVVAKGTVRKVPGISGPTRWIVDVEQLAERDANARDEETTVRITGQLRFGNPAAGEPSGSVVEVGDMLWSVDLSKDKEIKLKSDSLTGKRVEVAGQVKRAANSNSPQPIQIQVERIEAAAALNNSK